MQRTKWLERKFSFDFPAGLMSTLLARLAGTVPRLEYIIKDLSNDALEKKTDNKWSIKEQIGHLAATESLHIGRIDDIEARREELRPAGFKPLPDYNSEDIGELMRRLDANRRQFIQRLEGLSDNQQLTSALHPRLQVKMRPVDIAYFAAEHDDHHIAAIYEYLKSNQLMMP